MSVGILYDEVFTDHHCMYFHPEAPERLAAAIRGFESAGVWHDAVRIAAREATTDELKRVHDPKYVQNVLAVLGEGAGSLDPDTFFSPGTRRAALCAAGGGIDLAIAVQRRQVEWGWAVVRPPGHHAGRGRPAGFCIFNNIGVAAAALLATTDAERIAIFDWDVHHGNGTQEQFWDNPNVLFVSAHQWPHFPGSGLCEQTGGSTARGRTVNFPLPAGCGDGELLAVMDEVFTPLVDAFMPHHILVSAGFDGHEDDPLAGMRVSTKCYGVLAEKLQALAHKHCQGRLTLFLEGGYDLQVLTEAIAAVATALQGRDPASGDFEWPSATPKGRTIIDKTKAEIRPYWERII